MVVAGETGSGKTTQLPKICLGIGRQKIAHTQPRRIAARTVSQRIAQELGVELGQEVGFQVRFTKKASSRSRLTVMTDGILLNAINFDRQLRQYDTIIIDEAHERSLNIDFLLGYLKALLPKRPELRVIVTSATIDTAKFSEHFSNAPIVEVSGRTYPVEIRYRPLFAENNGVETAIDQIDGISLAVDELIAEGPGDILVFLSGEREIRDTQAALSRLTSQNVEVKPLYARLSVAEQHQIFTKSRGRRIVLATNVAETSITVPGIRYVVDAGTARISRYSNRTKVQRLPIEPISQASANQRAGRCGRVGPGICIRLYSEEDYLVRDEFTEPEILRTNLASVILQMAAAGLGNIERFPFVESPDKAQIADGLRLLEELGALKRGTRRNPRLTHIGRKLARIPVDPRLGRMLLEADQLGCLREVQIIVAGISIPDVRENPSEHREQSTAMHRRFFTDECLMIFDSTNHPSEIRSNGGSSRKSGRGPAQALSHQIQSSHQIQRQKQPTVQQSSASGGDIIALLRLWKYLGQARNSLSGNQFRKLCRNEYLNFLRVREWQDLRMQLRQVCKDLGMKRNETPATREAIVTAVLSGLLSHVGLLDLKESTKTRGRQGARKNLGPREYLGARGVRFAIQPGSALAKTNPELVVAVELVETTRLWARTIEAIKPEWVEKVAASLLKRNYSEPYWSSSAGAVLAQERATLYGVPIYSDRLVHYAKIDPVLSREMFIQHALVAGEWKVNYPFIEHNQRLREQADELEERTRRRDIVVSDREIYDFFDSRIPSEVNSVTSFEAWWRRLGDEHALKMDFHDLADQPDDLSHGSFPDTWQVGGLELPITYVFDPGSGADGVTITIPLPLVNRVPSEPFTWQVPGMRLELAKELLRTLPKSVRTNFVPALDYAKKALNWLNQNGADKAKPFCAELGRALLALTGVQVDDTEWDPSAVPNFLQVSFVIIDHGRRVAADKDLEQLKVSLAERVTKTLTEAARKETISGAKTWSFGTVARQIEMNRRGVTAVGYPAIKDEGDSVAVVVCDNPRTAQLTHLKGLRRLLVLTNPDPTRWVVAHLSNPDKISLSDNPYHSVPELLFDAWLKTSDRLLRQFSDPLEIRSQEAFERVQVAVRQQQADQMSKVVKVAAAALRKLAAAKERIELLDPNWDVFHDLKEQVENLVFKGFISAIRDPWYDQVPKYLEAAAIRAESARVNPAKDEQLVQPILDIEDAYFALCDAQPEGQLVDEIDDIGFMIEELRVQTFAQRLGTSTTVSVKRIRNLIDKVK